MSTVWLFSGTREELTPEERVSVTSVFGYETSPDLVVHGDCPTGIDAFVAGWFKRVVAMPAQWKTHRNAAGPMRNSEMVTVVSALVRCGWDAKVFAFPRPDSRGTRDLIRKAQTAGLSVVVTELGGGK